MPAVLPAALPILLPDLRNAPPSEDRPPEGRPFPAYRADQFLFFDLETTGLSSGAGTTAFLAAFGKFAEQGGLCGELIVDQFLLLDYPGEGDFLEGVLSFIESRGASSFLTTYNGKAFDSQILKTRCLMNGFVPPSLPQADLLHPARRLWKRMLPSCSQAVIETMVLGIDRSGDLPGALAPDIWFAFLRSGGEAGSPEEAALEGICDHNVRDISGLASLFRAFANVAASPPEAAAVYRCDTENLAMLWRRAQRLNPEKDLAAALLEKAASEYPRARLRLALDRFRQGRHGEGRGLLSSLLDGAAGEASPAVQALALRTLAIDAERRRGNLEEARRHAERALELEGLPPRIREDLTQRFRRLNHEPTN
jgi:uncharacterized protein YprB with RNaseH-like and TPR domain